MCQAGTDTWDHLCPAVQVVPTALRTAGSPHLKAWYPVPDLVFPGWRFWGDSHHLATVGTQPCLSFLVTWVRVPNQIRDQPWSSCIHSVALMCHVALPDPVFPPQGIG